MSRRLKLKPYLLLYAKLKSKCTKDLNIKTNTLNLLEDKISKTFDDIGIGKDFLNPTRNNIKKTKTITRLKKQSS